MQQRRVVVTGLGALTPIGNTVPAFWEAMMAGRSGAAPITLFDPEGFDTTFACEVKDFVPEDHLDRKFVRRLDRFSQFALVAAAEALNDAGFDTSALSEDERDRFGVVFGSGIGGMRTFEEQTKVLVSEGPQRISPFFIPMMILDIAPGHISMVHGLRGPNYAAVSACATSNHNLADAVMLIQRGAADVMVTGGSDASVTALGVGGFNALKALSTRNDSPETASRPFDITRDGFVMGEGAGALVLEELGHALARGAKIYCEIAGFGASADAHHLTAPEPEGKGAILAMKAALRDAEMQPEEIDYLNMHGTSTPLGDKAETKAIKAVFGDHAYAINCSSTKSMTGHLLGAAGAVEAVACILAIKHQTATPTINIEQPDPECDLNYTPGAPQQRDIRVAMSNAFGFGGHNTSVIFKRFEA
ncbi:MAG: beta-ketoacyl-ACP synthase II [Bacteroidetes bacterium]|nr:beta-ketoacyl-ACP synthase II [Bacteroidota bacterium]